MKNRIELRSFNWKKYKVQVASERASETLGVPLKVGCGFKGANQYMKVYLAPAKQWLAQLGQATQKYLVQRLPFNCERNVGIGAPSTCTLN